MVNCNKCGTQNRDDTNYCKNCGAKLSAGSVITCGKCGASNQGSSLFCNRCGKRLATAAASVSGSKTSSGKQSTKTAQGLSGPDRAKTSTTIATKSYPPSPSSKNQPPRADKTRGTSARGIPAEPLPDWLSRFYETTPSQTRLIPTHDLLRMANALGIDVDYSTLRFWQKRGLVPKPTRGRVSSGRGTRGYYDPSLIDRLSFIREIQKLYALNLDAIRDELNHIDEQFETGNPLTSDPFKGRLAELKVQHDVEAKRTLATVLYKALGLEPGEIASITIQKTNGQVIEFLSDKFALVSESH